MATAATQLIDKRWYIVHAYSNFEKKVAESIREQAKQRGLEELFEQVLVPTEKVTEVRRGRKIDAERKFFPGYVLVKMKLTDEAFHLIKNTPKVTGFLGAENKPMPISETAKVTWPTRRETTITTIMVFVMVALASIFFFAADQIIRSLITLILGIH